MLFAVGDRTHTSGWTDDYKNLKHKQCIVPVDNATMSSLDNAFNDTQQLRLVVKVTVVVNLDQHSAYSTSPLHFNDVQKGCSR